LTVLAFSSERSVSPNANGGDAALAQSVRRFKVSAIAAARRALDLGLITMAI
jgi:Zn-dependent peptidase ImmA (M78 family)